VDDDRRGAQDDPELTAAEAERHAEPGAPHDGSPDAPEAPLDASNVPDRPVAGWAPPPDTASAPIVGWAPPLAAGGSPVMDVGSVVGRTFDVFGREWSLFMLLSAPVAITYALQGFFPSDDLAAVLGLSFLAGVIGIFTVTVIVAAADAVAEDRPTGIGQAVAPGVRAIPSLVALSLLVLLVVGGLGAVTAFAVVALGTEGLGSILLLLLLVVVLPVAIYVGLRLTPVLPLLVLERAGPRVAIRRSWNLSRGRVLAIFAITFVVSLTTVPALWGASLLALEPGPAAATGLGVATLLTTARTVIATTLIYRDLTSVERPVLAEGASRPGKGRAIGFGLVLGLGIVLLVVGFGMFGARLGELAAGAFPSPGVIRTGHAEGFLDACEPGELATEFAIGDEIWIGGYFTRMVDADEVVAVSFLVNGMPIVDAEPLEAGVLGFGCYYEIEPFVPTAAGTYRLEVSHDGEVIASGAFTVTD